VLLAQQIVHRKRFSGRVDVLKSRCVICHESDIITSRSCRPVDQLDQDGGGDRNHPRSAVLQPYLAL
jgi:hypothetical protein